MTMVTLHLIKFEASYKLFHIWHHQLATAIQPHMLFRQATILMTYLSYLIPQGQYIQLHSTAMYTHIYSYVHFCKFISYNSELASYNVHG